MAYIRKKLDDHLWMVEFSNVEDPVVECRLLDQWMNFLRWLPFEDERVRVDISDHGDGLFMVAIVTQSQAVAYVVLPDFSDAYACYKSLFRHMMCHREDPCDDCDDQMRTRLYDLNAIMALVETLREMVLLEQSQSAGIYSVNIARKDLLEQMGAMFDSLRIITKRCGLCHETFGHCQEC